ncbi:hypothetical protein CN573_17275, partial [Bacillus wiedmannii]|uniref:hypothetical protein n=1 Tax=Bacillus wiedmannii TaxID=1890302 RepID=UPI000BFAF0E8
SSAEAKKLGGGSTARKSTIGSTNNQWGMNKTPTDYRFTLCYACKGFCVKLWIATRLYSGLAYIIFK